MGINKGFKVVAAAAVFGLSGSSFAADATFENHLQSTPIVSPAQLYQVEDMKTDFALGYKSDELSIKTDAGKATGTTTGTELFAAGIFNIKSMGLRAGVSVDYVTDDFAGKDTAGTKSTADATYTTLTPQAALPVGPVVLGAAFDFVQNAQKVEDTDEAKVSYTTFRPGALFTTKELEAGITYVSPHNAPADEAKELSAISPAQVILHGRYAIDRNLAVGGIIGNKNYKALNDEALKDQTNLTATTEYTAGAIKVEGDLGYNTAYYKDTDYMTSENIGTLEVGAGADYAVNKDAAVGGALSYKFGSEKSKGTEYAANDLGFAIRGNVKF
jgi:hypothetical protein